MSNVQKVSELLKECHDCDAQPGQHHKLGCAVERCPRCGGQLLTCLECGCAASNDNEPWPPPLDDRDIWTGEWPGSQECREFGWFARAVSDHGWQPCQADAQGAIPDLNRLHAEADWDRWGKRYVRTNLTASFADMTCQGIIWERGSALNKKRAITDLTRCALRSLDQGRAVAGFAYYTVLGKLKQASGKDFTVHFGPFEDPRLQRIDLPSSAVGKVVCDCLHGHGVEFRPGKNPDRSICVVAASIARVSCPTEGN
jgi:hypothetical protein